MKFVFIFPVLLVLSGCATAKIVKVADDTYIISKSDPSPGFGPSKTLKVEVEAEANQFAQQQNKVAVPVSIRSSPAFPLHFASVEYRFRLMDKADPAAIRALALPFPSEGEVRTAAPPVPSKTDATYDELLKLDELKKKGIITQAEFDIQKRKILEK